MTYAKIIFLVLIAAYFLDCGLHPYEYHFIDGVNLLFHEAGHPIFGLFGNDFLMVMGGTLGQLIMPLVIVVYFSLTGQRYSSAVAGLWFSENFFPISVYAKDAVAMELPLVGNGDRIHDWNYMLSELHMLNQDQQIGNLAHAAGLVLIGVFFLAGVWYSRAAVEQSGNSAGGKKNGGIDVDLNLLSKGCEVLGFPVTTGELRLFGLYLGEIRKWNKKVNLTAITEPEEIIVKHFLDSLALRLILPIDSEKTPVSIAAALSQRVSPETWALPKAGLSEGALCGAQRRYRPGRGGKPPNSAGGPARRFPKISPPATSGAARAFPAWP